MHQSAPGAKRTFHGTLLGAVVALGVFAGTQQANAYQIFFGEDLNNSASTPLASFPNAAAAEAGFLSNLVGVGTEDFEGFATGTGAPLNLSFPGAGTATLSGGNGEVATVTPGTTNGFGRYGVSGSNYWEVEAGGTNNFSISFSQPIAAFGFFGIDIGDFGGQLRLELSNGGTTILDVPNTSGSFGSTDGSVLFFGAIAENASEQFASVAFLTTTGQGDVFGFDDFTIGSQEQVVMPEPATLALLGAGLAGIGLARRRRIA